MDFPDGIRAYKPGEKVPDFIISTLVVNEHFLNWLSNNAIGGEVKLDIKLSKDGNKHYIQHNTYKSG